MPCIECRLVVVSCAAWLAACSSLAPPIAPIAPIAPVPAVPPAAASGASAPAPIAPPVRARNWDDYRRQAALRLVATNPDGSHTGPVVEPLLAIPVLEIELEADGRVRRITVLRQPTQARDTTQLAIDAVRRAAPFGSVSHLPRPWKFAEIFLFDDSRRFKPRTLDE